MQRFWIICAIPDNRTVRIFQFLTWFVFTIKDVFLVNRMMAAQGKRAERFIHKWCISTK